MSSRKKPVTKQIREERRKVAEQMQQEYDALTLEQKLSKLPPAPAAAKQRARLMLQLEARKNQPSEESKVSKNTPAKKSK